MKEVDEIISGSKEAIRMLNKVTQRLYALGLVEDEFKVIGKHIIT